MPTDDDGTERELKLGLPDEAAWRGVRALAGPGQIVDQANHFLADPGGRFARAGIAVRLRHEHAASPRTSPRDRYRLTVKGPEAEPAERRGTTFLSRRAELEVPLEADRFDEARAHGLVLRPWIADWRRTARSPESRMLVDRLDHELADLPLRPWTGFHNRRETIALALSDPAGPLAVRLEVDRTELPGGRIDHELEVEATAESGADLARIERALLHWLEARLDLRPTRIGSKLARLAEALRSQNGANDVADDGDGPTASPSGTEPASPRSER